MKNSILIHYFKANLGFPLKNFVCLENVPYKAFYSRKNGFGSTFRRCGIHSKPQLLLQKTCISYASEILAAYTGMCLCTHVLAHVCGPKATLVILFSKIDFCSFKKLYFPF